MKKKTSIEDYLLARIDDLVEKLVASEVRKKDLEEQLNIFKDFLAKIALRPVVVGLDNEQVDRIITGVGKIVAENLEKPMVH